MHLTKAKTFILSVFVSCFAFLRYFLANQKTTYWVKESRNYAGKGGPI